MNMTKEKQEVHHDSNNFLKISFLVEIMFEKPSMALLVFILDATLTYFVFNNSKQHIWR